MGLVIKEILQSINDCEKHKETMLREADRIHEERKCYEHIKHLLGLVEEGDIECSVKV